MMLPLRIRKAEVALADGRLEEAYRQAVRDDVRDHRKGQRLINRLTKAYENRARLHLGAGNHSAAMTDADRALRLGGNQPGIVALREEVRTELDGHTSQKQARNQKIAAARRCLASGEFSLGAKLCKDVDDSSNTVANLMQDAELNRRLVQTAVERGRKAIRSGSWDEAIQALNEAKQLQPTHADVVDLARQTTQGIGKQTRQLIAKGRLDQAELLLGQVRRHADQSIDLQELSNYLRQCRKAMSATSSLQPSELVTQLKSLKPIIPEARWLDAAIKDAENIARSLEQLRTGPLGSIDNKSISETKFATPSVRPVARQTPPMRVFDATPVVPTTFLLHLDGTGSVLVSRSDSITIGTASRTKRVDVPLRGQVGLPTMTIERLDDEYFFSSDAPVPINGKSTANTLLTSQDQVHLGRRGSMHFVLPNAASTSATLDFAGVRLAGSNARRVILMDDTIVIGPQPSAHIQSLHLERAMVLHWRNSELRIRPMSRTLENEGAVLAMDRPHDVDGLSLVVTPATGIV